MSINGITKKVVKAKANDEVFDNISITSLNSADVNYELTYKIYEDKKCTKEIKTNNVIIKYSSQTINSVNGKLKLSGNVNIRVVLFNSSKNNYYVKFDINASKDRLALVKQINQKYDEDDFTIAAYIYGQLSTSFPTNSGYATSVVCKANGNTSNAYGEVKWDTTNSKWVLQVVGLDKSVTRCNVYFEHTILKDAIMADNTVSSPQTVPGTDSSSSTEDVFASSTDDYGTTYYFRGNIPNNYVKFANMCWRVVRITGNYATKLILYNYNPNSVTNPCDTSADADYYAFAHNGDTYTSAFNSYSSTDNAYVGFMYGTPGSSSYAATHANTNKSTILQFLETWYNANLASYSSQLADVIWCNDKSTTTGTKSALGFSTDYNESLAYGTNLTLYKATDRLTAPGSWESAGGTGPSFICPNDQNGGLLSKFTVNDTINGNGDLTYPIGLITADEMAFAGFKYGFLQANTSYYLYNNTNSDWYSMTPMNYMHYLLIYYPVVWFSSNLGAWGDYSGVVSSRAVRPSIAIKGEIQISSGIGTSTDPYVVVNPS
jgi:hypothetical protein